MRCMWVWLHRAGCQIGGGIVKCGIHRLTTACIPDPNGPVVRARDDSSTVVRVLNRLGRPGVTFERLAHHLTGPYVPGPYGLVVRAGDDSSAVVRMPHRVDRPGVAFERFVHYLTGVCVLDPYGADSTPVSRPRHPSPQPSARACSFFPFPSQSLSPFRCPCTHTLVRCVHLVMF